MAKAPHNDVSGVFNFLSANIKEQMKDTKDEVVAKDKPKKILKEASKILQLK
jgi:hypothetical protein